MELLATSIIVLSAITLTWQFGIRKRKRISAEADESLRSLSSYLLSLKDRFDAMTAELERARRYQRPASIVVLQLGGDSGVTDEPVAIEDSDSGAWSNRISFLMAGCVIGQSLRGTDILAYCADTDRYVVCLPELSRREARRTIHRITALVRSRAFVTLKSGWAEFPKDGVTLVELLARAQADLDRPDVAQILPERATASIHQWSR